MICPVCKEKIQPTGDRKDYVERGNGGICHSCIDRYYGGITQYRKVHGHVPWRTLPKRSV